LAKAINPSLPCIDDLVEEYFPAVIRLCVSILDDEDDAQDAAQETFIAACMQIEAFRGESSLKTWLFAIAINTCRGALRKRRRRHVVATVLGGLQKIFGQAGSPEETATHADQTRRLWTAVDELDEKHRLPIVLHYVHDLTASEIAAILGVQEGTIHSRLHYARKRLGNWLIQADRYLEVL
jgi:RNA polymerase sigma-70 factor (ECF subfamily)